MSMQPWSPDGALLASHIYRARAFNLAHALAHSKTGEGDDPLAEFLWEHTNYDGLKRNGFAKEVIPCDH